MVAFPSNTSVRGEVDWPEELFEEQDQAPNCGSVWEDVFTVMNDKKGPTDDEREDWIREGFKTLLGIDVEFTGKYE